jgi:hypothetical protein
MTTSSIEPTPTSYNETTVIDSLLDFEKGTCAGCFVSFYLSKLSTSSMTADISQEGMLLWQQVAFMGDEIFKQFISDVFVASDVSVSHKYAYIQLLK